ncbi:MAG: hypothetical protein ACJ759_06120, partial [Thermoanaerobaculia bacterium]
MSAAPSHRRRFLIGLTLAALVAVFLGAALLAAARAGESRERSERSSVVTLLALAQLIDRAGGGAPVAEGEEGMGIGDELAAIGTEPPAEDPGVAVRSAVAAFAKAHPEVKAVRVVAFEGIRLEASTNPQDQAPRRLEREEKPLYDLGQKLRAAVAGNR